MDTLFNDGVAVLKTPFVDDMEAIREEFMQALRSMPEYKRSDNPDLSHDGAPIDYVAGGFSALGNPSSFHNEFVRKLRQHCMHTLAPVFKEVRARLGSEYKLEQLVDRMMYRLAGQKACGESFHRDEAEGALADDVILGGWINLDCRHNQHFSCVKGTHKDQDDSIIKACQKRGFAPLSKEEAKCYSAKKTDIVIPPGHIVIFFENMVHEVVSRKMAYNTARLFLGWRLTKSDLPLDSETEKCLANGLALKIKSGQTPPMWPVLYRTNWRGKLESWSTKTFLPELLTESVVGSGKNKGEKYKHVHRFIQPLEHYGIAPNYPLYDEDELNLYKPGIVFNVVPFQSSQKVNIFV